jgi:mandelate racemase
MNLVKVRQLDAAPVLVPLAEPVRTASGSVTHAPLVLVDLHTEVASQPGPTGCAYLFTYTPLALKPTVEMLRGLNALLAGQPCAPVALFDQLQARFRLLGHTGVVGMALAGIDMAAWDALAKAQGLPLVRALGGVPQAVAAYASHGMDGLARGVELAHQAASQGFAGMKIKVGYATLAEDVAVIRAVHAALNDHGDCNASPRTLMVDYNQSLSFAEALARCAALDRLADEGIALGWIEEPLRQDDFAGHAALAAQVRTPIQLGENWFSVAEMAQAMGTAAPGLNGLAAAGDLAMPDLMKIGGVTAWQRAAGLAAAARRPVSSHLFHEVTAHLMPVTPTAHWLEYLPLADPVLQVPLVPAGGQLRARDDLLGNGLAWDAAAVAQYAA